MNKIQDTKYLFSIVIANYNQGKYIGSAIQSVLNQSEKSFELIIVDGGSTDNSVEIIKTYSDKISWWVSEKDKGQSDAFNKGFSKAQGKFYFWLNADDILLPNSLKLAKQIIYKNPNTLWFAANTIFFNEYEVIKKCSIGPKWNTYLFKHNPIYVNGPSSIFHNSLFHKFGGFDINLNYTMDGDLWYKFYNQNINFVRINKFFWGFRIHEESKTSHAFNNEPNKKFAMERNHVLTKNNHQNYKLFNYLMIAYKTITLTYIKSLFYTLKYKGKSINTFKQ